MRRWIGAVEWSIEHDRFFIRKKLVSALLPDNLSCHGELRGQELLDKKHFLENALTELDVIDGLKTYVLHRAAMLEKRSELKEQLARVQEARFMSEEMRARAQAINPSLTPD